MRFQGSDEIPVPSEEQLREWLHADPVTVDAVPEVYALYRSDDWYDECPDDERGEVGVLAWVFALPDGRAHMLSVGGERRQMWSTSLHRAAGFWAEHLDANLVAVRTTS